jgi:HEAT repeat protein
MTKPHRKWLLLLLVLPLVATGIAVLWPGEKEPKCQGKTLSEWLLYADDIKWPPHSTADAFEDIAGPKAKEAAVAVRAMASEAVPALLKWFEYKPSAVRTNICWAVWKLQPSPRTRRNRIYQKLIFGQGLIRSELARAGFLMLGPAAAPAVPKLAQIIEEDADPLRRRQAMVILISLGDAGAPPLLRALTNKANPDRMIVLLNIGTPHRASASTTSAIPVLVQCLADKNPQTVINAAIRLESLASQPEIVIPALTNALGGTNIFTQTHIIRAIAAFESRATDAVPALLPLLQSPLPVIPREATNALRKISPDVLLTNQFSTGQPPAPR